MITYDFRDASDDLSLINAAMPVEEVLGGLAEEAAELAKAAEKMRRKVVALSPTPKTYNECYESLKEEIVDVVNFVEVLGTYRLFSGITNLGLTPATKLRRWRDRLICAFARREGEDRLDWYK